jgi:predicted nuclease with TOPRIM domain
MELKNKIHNTEDLKKAMDELQSRINFQESEIKENFVEVKENLRPKRVVRNTFSFLAETPEIQKTLVNTVVGFILGYASKKAVEVLSEQSLDRTVQNILNHQMTKLENKQPESLLAKGITLFRRHTPPDSPIYPFVKYR